MSWRGSAYNDRALEGITPYRVVAVWIVVGPLVHNNFGTTGSHTLTPSDFVWILGDVRKAACRITVRGPVDLGGIQELRSTVSHGDDPCVVVVARSSLKESCQGIVDIVRIRSVPRAGRQAGGR